MADIVIMGAGLGGAIMAYEMKDADAAGRPADRRHQGSRSIISCLPTRGCRWAGASARRSRSTWRRPSPGAASRFKPVPVDQASCRRTTGSSSTTAPSLDYDYLIIATGPELAFDEIEGLGPDGFTQSVCHIDHAEKARPSFEAFCKNPGPIVIGAAQGASCFGPAYEFTFILETELRRRKIRDQVPMTFVTAEPYIGHLGLDGVGDTKGLLESAMREHHIKWMTNARVKKVEAGKMTVEEVGDDGAVKATHELPFGFSMMLPAFRGIAPLRGIEGLVNPRGFVMVDKHQRNPEIPEHLLGRRLRRHSAGRSDTRALRRAEDRLHDRIDGDGDGAKYRRPARAARSRRLSGHLERGLPRRFRRQRHRLRRAAANPAAQRQLVVVGQMGSCGQDRLREIFPAQDAQGRERTVL